MDVSHTTDASPTTDAISINIAEREAADAISMDIAEREYATKLKRQDWLQKTAQKLEEEFRQKEDEFKTREKEFKTWAEQQEKKRNLLKKILISCSCVDNLCTMYAEEN